MAPDHLVAGHSTGYKAVAEIVQRFPAQHLTSSVGTWCSFTA
jgi:metal-dependent hydrolase (beta-lactamase superfamily II)